MISDFGIVAYDDHVGWQGVHKVGGRGRRCHGCSKRCRRFMNAFQGFPVLRFVAFSFAWQALLQALDSFQDK